MGDFQGLELGRAFRFPGHLTTKSLIWQQSHFIKWSGYSGFSRLDPAEKSFVFKRTFGKRIIFRCFFV
jgi:hypothetical protein